MTTKSYKKLLQEIRGAILKGEARRDRAKVFMYWRIGRAIEKDILKNKSRAGYGSQLIPELAKDLKFSRTELYYALEFSRSFPIVPAQGQLSWQHYRILLSINDSKIRKEFTREAISGQWSSRVLAQKIRDAGIETKSKKAIQACLLPRRGKPGDYRVISFKGKPMYDLGFSCYKEVQGRQVPRKAAAGAVLYSYDAWIERVVDGDTVWAKIDLGFGFWVRQKLRLRGIDSPELGTKEGERAKKFLSQKLPKPGSGRPVLMTTTRSDKYDRYLADIFLPVRNAGASTADTPVIGAKYEGARYLNEALLQAGHAKLAIE